MSETILIGYLINIKDYQIFDNILTFFGDDNNIYNLLSLGSKKILSKNGRNIKIGAKVEIEFFQARSYLKLSKLKKINIIEDVSWKIDKNFILDFLNNFLIKNNNNFQFNEYHKIVMLVKKNVDYQFIWLITLFKIIKSTGIKFHLSSCSICGDKKIKTTSISFYGFLCTECAYLNNEYIYDKNVNEIFYLLENKKYKEVIFKDKESKDISIRFLKGYLNINY